MITELKSKTAGLITPVYISKSLNLELNNWVFKEKDTGKIEERLKPSYLASSDLRKIRLEYLPEEASPEKDDKDWTNLKADIRIENPAYFRSWISLPKKCKGKNVVLEIENMALNTMIYINGKTIETNPRGARNIDITENIKPGSQNLITISSPKGKPEGTRITVYDLKLDHWRIKEKLNGERNGWYKQHLDDSKWHTITIPESSRKRGNSFEGIIWYRKKFKYRDKPGYNSPLRLNIKEAPKCQIYLNNKLIGLYRGKDTKKPWGPSPDNMPPQTEFFLPASYLKKENTLVLAAEIKGKDTGITENLTINPYYVTENIKISIIC
jgi:hypothetical protein